MRLLLIIFVFFLLNGTAIPSENELSIAGFSSDEAVALGKRMYREGILPSGEPMQAIVMGDIPVDGRMFTCDDCHQRSGLGSVEGTVITWPTNGADLFQARRRTGAWRPSAGEQQDIRKKALPGYWHIEDVRPAYTNQTLAVALRTGIDPAGRKMDPIMPLFLLNGRDMAILIHYLKNLSSVRSPGIDDTTIRFATVITDNVPEKKQQAMLSVIQAHVDAHNAQSRHQERRSTSGPFYKTEMYQAYRRIELLVWQLNGPEDTWAEQLETYYRKKPVFGMLGGISNSSWLPIHTFCEEKKIPSIFPLTELPVVSDSDWYTLYFSKGYYQEGQAVARYLHTSKQVELDERLVIVYREDSNSDALTRGFSESWQKFHRTKPEYLKLSPEKKLTGQFWQEVMSSQQATTLLLWLEQDDLGALSSLALGEHQPEMIFLSAKLLDNKLDAVPDELRDKTYLTFPYSLPDLQKKRMIVVQRWLEVRGIPVIDLEMQAKMYFLGWMLPGAFKHMRSEFYREYFLEGYDMMVDQDYAIPVYPRLTFGPGQRYASKGCYIVQLTQGSNPSLLQKSDWVIH